MSDEEKVVSLRGDQLPPQGEPNQLVVDWLKRTLEEAQAGRIIGIGITVLFANRESSWKLVGSVGSFGMVGAAMIMTDAIKEAAAVPDEQ